MRKAEFQQTDKKDLIATDPKKFTQDIKSQVSRIGQKVYEIKASHENNDLDAQSQASFVKSTSEYRDIIARGQANSMLAHDKLNRKVVQKNPILCNFLTETKFSAEQGHLRHKKGIVDIFKLQTESPNVQYLPQKNHHKYQRVWAEQRGSRSQSAQVLSHKISKSLNQSRQRTMHLDEAIRNYQKGMIDASEFREILISQKVDISQKVNSLIREQEAGNLVDHHKFGVQIFKDRKYDYLPLHDSHYRNKMKVPPEIASQNYTSQISMKDKQPELDQANSMQKEQRFFPDGQTYIQKKRASFSHMGLKHVIQRNSNPENNINPSQGKKLNSLNLQILEKQSAGLTTPQTRNQKSLYNGRRDGGKGRAASQASSRGSGFDIISNQGN